MVNPELQLNKANTADTETSFLDLHLSTANGFHNSYRLIGYNLNVMRQSACLVCNPVVVDNYAAFFKCTPVGRASDSMMIPT